MNEWLTMLKCKVMNAHLITIYYLEKKSYDNKPIFHEIAIQSVLEHNQRTEILANYFKGYKLFGQNNQEIAYLRHDKWIREEAVGFLQELPLNTTYIKNYELPKLHLIVNEVQREGRAISTSAKWFEWRKRKQLTALGFQRVEHVWMHQLFKWKKVYRQQTNWGKYLAYQGRKLEHGWHLTLLSLLL